MRAKHYMLCVTSLAQAWEMFFATFVYSNYLYRPFYHRARNPGRLERFDDLAERLGEAIRDFTFDQLRNVLVNTVVERVRPGTLDESGVAIARIEGDNFGQRPAKARVDAFSDSSVRAVLLQLQGLRIGELRTQLYAKTPTGPVGRKSKIAAKESGSCTGQKVGCRSGPSTSGRRPRRGRHKNGSGDRHNPASNRGQHELLSSILRSANRRLPEFEARIERYRRSLDTDQ